MYSPHIVEIVDRLVEHQHISVPERLALPNGQAPLSLVVAALMRIVEDAGSYPRGRDAEHDYSGGVLIATEPGCEIHWKAEYSIGRYHTYRIDHFTHLRDAADAYVREAWLEGGIDAVMIDPDA